MKWNLCIIGTTKILGRREITAKRAVVAKIVQAAFLVFTVFASPSRIVGSLGPEEATSRPELRLELKPHMTGGSVDYIDVSLAIDGPTAKAGATLLRMPLIVASIPTPRYDGEAIQARDDSGGLPLTQKDEPPTSSGTYRQWLVSRQTMGNVVVTFRAPMRAVGPTTRPGPLFDLRAESGGLNGAGIAFLPLPISETSYLINVHWDLSSMPQGARGVWSMGAGDASTTGKAEMLADTYYAAGPLKSFPADPSSAYTMYWLGDPPFDARVVAERIQKFYLFASQFFGDQGGEYRVFVRKNPYHGGGGTSLTRSFMFGYSDERIPKPDEMHGLLAHEIVHNWPGLQGEHGDTAWYSEGAAEYYSILLSYRAGVYDAAKFLSEINKRASAYYTNPLQALTNEQAAEKFWTDSRAQRVPYGRGFMYLAQVDAEIRAASEGKRSLDNLVLELRSRQKGGAKHGVSEWLELVTKELGSNAQQEFHAMTSGHRLVALKSSFAPCFSSEASEDKDFDLGFDMKSVEGGDRRVHALVAGSAAAKAGLQEGDEIVESSRLADIQDDPTAVFHLKVRRGSQELSFSYVPRGKAVPTYHWVRMPNVPDSTCKL
jgi:hypothetical protein